MRKRTVSYLADTIFWNIVYFIPVIAYFILLWKFGLQNFGSVFDTIGLNIATNSTVFESLSNIFGVDGILPLFASTDLIVFLTYYVNVFIAHIFIDLVLFIPKLAKKWMNKFTHGDE